MTVGGVVPLCSLLGRLLLETEARNRAMAVADGSAIEGGALLAGDGLARVDACDRTLRRPLEAPGS